MTLAKAIYHRIIPAAIRNPIGLVRRRFEDRIVRATHGEPLPPVALLMNVQMTPYVKEFIAIGRRSADSITRALAPRLPSGARVLDFGCGCGRTLLPLRQTGWEVHGCDVDATAIQWLSSSVDHERFRVTTPAPPLPWPDGYFDAVYAVSVFTHFSEAEQRAWAADLARVLRPCGLAAISSMGPGILANFPAHATAANIERLDRDGFFHASVEGAFNAQATFHSPAGLARMLGDEFRLWQFSEQGLDGFQDLSVFVRRE